MFIGRVSYIHNKIRFTIWKIGILINALNLDLIVVAFFFTWATIQSQFCEDDKVPICICMLF